MKHLSKPIATEPPTDQAYTLGGAIDGYEFAEVDTLVIGRLKLPPTTVALMEFHDVEKIYREGFGIAIDGLLGSDILNQCHAVISYARSTLTLHNPESLQSPS